MALRPIRRLLQRDQEHSCRLFETAGEEMISRHTTSSCGHAPTPAHGARMMPSPIAWRDDRCPSLG